MNKVFLWEFKKHCFHILPDTDTTQDENLRNILFHNTMSIKSIAQKDGSLLRYIYTTIPLNDTIKAIKEIMGKGIDVWEQRSKDTDVIHRRIKNEKLMEHEGYEYITIWMHTFINKARTIPLLVNNNGFSFYDLSPLFPNLEPEDNIGTLVDFNQGGILTHELLLEGKLPRVIKYHSYIRMCHCCGVISDISKPITHSWIRFNKNKRHLEAQQTLKENTLDEIRSKYFDKTLN